MDYNVNDILELVPRDTKITQCKFMYPAIVKVIKIGKIENHIIQSLIIKPIIWIKERDPEFSDGTTQVWIGFYNITKIKNE